MWVLKPVGLIILLMVGYVFFKPGKLKEIVRGIGRSVGAFKQGLDEESDPQEEEHPPEE